jgi:hypothetical protein
MAARLNEADLPLAEGSKLPDFVKLGNKMLIDETELKKFSKIENSARSYLRAHAHMFPIAQAHFVPNKTLLGVLEKLEEFRVKYFELVEAFVANYDTLKEAMLTKHTEHRATLEPYYPAAVHIRHRFGFQVGIFEVSFPKQMKAIDLASVQAEATAREAMQLKFEAEWRKQYSQSMQEVDSFLTNAVASTRGRIVEVFDTIANKIKNRDVISTVNVKTMSGIIEAFDGLDFLNDASVRSKLDNVKGLLAAGRDFKEDNEAIASLSSAINEVLDVARSTTDLDSLTGDYIRRIEI